MRFWPLEIKKFSPTRIFFICAFWALILFFSTNISANPLEDDHSHSKTMNWTYKGIAITAYWHTAFQTPYLYRQIDYYIGLGINAIELTPVWYQKSLSDDKIYSDRSKTITDDDLKKAILYAKRKGLRVNLKPHVDPYPYLLNRLSEEEFNHFYKSASNGDKQLLKQCYTSTSSHEYKQKPNIQEYQKKACMNIMEQISSAFFWRARINPVNVESWFLSYKVFLEHYLKIALETNVDLFTVGTELVSMTRPKYLTHWQNLMRDLRTYVKKNARNYQCSPNIRFTYAAHASEVFGTPNSDEREWWRKHKKYKPQLAPSFQLEFGEQLNNTNEPFERYSIFDPNAPQNLKKDLQRFWDLFDFASITVYFELGDHLTFMVDDDKLELSRDDKEGRSFSLQKRWQEKVQYLERWRVELGMDIPMVFAELGYRSINYGHYKPYKSHGKIFSHLDPNEKEVFNGENQANAYKAAFRTLDNVPWLEGVFLWQEEIKDPPAYVNTENTSYSLIGKPAASVILSAFMGEDSKQSLPDIPSCLSVDLNYIDRYDFDAGGGLSNSIQDKESWYTWTKFRIRPISQCLLSDILDTIQFGLWFSFTTGGGEIPASKSEYDWNRLLGGTTLKILRKGITWDVDLGIGHVRDNCTAQNDRYRSKQKDKLYYIFSHFEWRRRDFGYKWLPKVALDFEGINVFSSDQSRSWEDQTLISDPFDRRRFELALTPDLVDIPIIKGNLRLSPSAFLGFGREYEEGYFEKVGLGITLGFNKSSEDTDLVNFRIAFQNTNEDQWEGTIWLNLLNLGRKSLELWKLHHPCF